MRGRGGHGDRVAVVVGGRGRNSGRRRRLLLLLCVGGLLEGGRQNGGRRHAEELGEELEEYLAQEEGHRTLAAEVDVHDDGTTPGAGGDEHHAEEIVEADVGDLVGGRGHVAREQEEEHKKGGEQVHAEDHLSGRLGRQTEEHNGAKGEEHAGQEENGLVEAALARHLDPERDVQVDLLAAFVLDRAACALRRQDLPLVGLDVVLAVDLLEAVVELNVDGVTVVCPTSYVIMMRKTK